MQQEVENFKKVNMISREQFDTLTPEPPVDPNQEVPPGPPRFQQGKRQGTQVGGTELVPIPSGERLGSSWGEGIWTTGVWWDYLSQGSALLPAEHFGAPEERPKI